MKRVLVTGASGLVGSHAISYILEKTDWEIVALVSKEYRGILKRLPLVIKNDSDYKRVKIIDVDLSLPINKELSKEIGSINYVFNYASASHIPDSVESPSAFIINNISIVVNLLDWAKTNDLLENFVQVGTDAVYGPLIDHKHKEWESIVLPGTPYAASKSAQDDICFSYWKTYGIPITLTNTMNVFGEMQGPEKFIPMTIKKILNKETVSIHSGSNGEIGSRYYIHAYSHVDSLNHIVNNIKVPTDNVLSKPNKFNIVGDVNINNLDLAKKIASIMDIDLKYELVNFNTSRPGHDLKYGLDGSLLFNTGWINPKPFEQGLEDTVKWFLNNKDWLYI